MDRWVEVRTVTQWKSGWKEYRSFNLVYNSHDPLKIKDLLNTGIGGTLHHAKHIIWITIRYCDIKQYYERVTDKANLVSNIFNVFTG